MKLLLSIEEVAEALSIEPTKAKELIRRGDIPSVTIGDRRLVAAGALEAYVQRLIDAAVGRAP